MKIHKSVILGLTVFLAISIDTSCSSTPQSYSVTPQPNTPSSPSATSTKTQSTHTLKSLELTPTQPPLGDYMFPSAIEDSSLADTIQTSLPEFIGIASFGGKSFCSYALVMPPEIGVDETVKVYMLVGCEEFFPKNGLLEQGTSLGEPIAITLEKQSGKWQIVDRQKPDVGKWAQSIKEIFPQQTWAMVFGSTRTLLASRNAVYRILNKQNIQQAEDFYGIPFIPTPRH